MYIMKLFLEIKSCYIRIRLIKCFVLFKYVISGGDSVLDAEAGGEHSNPFLDKELKRQSEEICKQLLRQPIPKLPISHKLIAG